ncbi:MAG TPA: hypothetical protein VH306_01055 [Gaiellaceae bacterium]
MQVQISDPARMLDLAAFLNHLGIVSRATGHDVLEVQVAHALNAARDPGADRVEIVRGLRDWCSFNPGVHANLL